MRNGLGHVRKLSGNRRKPYAAIVTVGYEYGEKQQDISFLKPVLTDQEYNDLLTRYTEYCGSQPKSRQIQKYIGYYATKKEGYLALSEYYQKPLDLKGNGITFADAWEYVKIIEYKNLSENSKTVYDNAYKKLSLFYKQQVRSITKFDIEKFLETQADYSQSYLDVMLEVFHKVFTYCINQEYIIKDESKDISVKSKATKRVKGTFEIKDIETLYEHRDNQYARIYLLLIYTGMRIDELINLKREDVHTDERYMYVQGTKTASARRLVPIHKELLPIIEDCLKTESVYLVHNLHGNKLDYGTVRKKMVNTLAELNIPTHTLHECRHTFSSLWTKNRLDETLRKKILGHKANDLTIDTYTHVYIEDIVAEIDKLSVH